MNNLHTFKFFIYQVAEQNHEGSHYDIPIFKQEYEHKRHFYTIHLNENLKPGKLYKISLHYTGYLNRNLKGFYRSSYIDDDGIER